MTKNVSRIDKLKKELKQQNKNKLNTFLKKEKVYYEIPNIKKEEEKKEDEEK